MHRRPFISIFTLGVLLLAYFGCDRQQQKPSFASDDGGQVRGIVSLSPAMTRMTVDLGFGEQIVGRTPWCTAVDESVPVVGDLNDIDFEMLARLKPTHIFIQPPQGGEPAELATTADERGWEITSVHLNSVADIGDALDAIADGLGLADTPIGDDHAARHRTLQSQLASLTAEPDGVVERKPVLLLYMTDPPSVFGVGTYLDDVLNHLGYVNATQARGWAQLTLEDLTRINPTAILFIQPNAAADVDVMEALGPVAELPIDAVRDGKVAVICHPDALLPSTSVIAVAAEMRAAIKTWK